MYIKCPDIFGWNATAIVLGRTSLIDAAFATITEPCPIETPGRMISLAAMQT